MSVVLDTNVLIAAVVSDGLCRDLVRVRVLPHTIVTSEPLLRELRSTSRNKFAVDPDELPLLRQLHRRSRSSRQFDSMNASVATKAMIGCWQPRLPVKQM